MSRQEETSSYRDLNIEFDMPSDLYGIDCAVKDVYLWSSDSSGCPRQVHKIRIYVNSPRA
jgi:hypothetical protein